MAHDFIPPSCPKVCVLCASVVATQPTRPCVTKLYLCCFVLHQPETGRRMLCSTYVVVYLYFAPLCVPGV